MLGLAWALGALADPTARPVTEQAEAGAIIPGATLPIPGVLSSGQPTLEQLERARQAGYRTVINLRSPSEPGFEWEQAAVERLGMSYINIPVAGVKDLTRENVERLDAALRSGQEAGGVLLHCASGNRNGALLALREVWLGGASPDAALALGKTAGLKGLEGATRELLGAPAVPAEQLPAK